LPALPISLVLEGIAQSAAGEYAPASRVGDTVMPRWEDGGVTTPPGFHEG
jgi:hypothetical protein